MYKIIAVDMDGTLLRSDRTISERTKKAISMAISKGAKFVISTGRPLEGVMPYIKFLGLDQIKETEQFIITFNGAVVLGLNPLAIKVMNTINGKDVRRIYERGLELGVLSHGFSTTRGFILEVDNPYSDIEVSYNGLDKSYTQFKDTKDDEQFQKFMLLGNKEQLDNVEKNIDDLRELYTVVRSTDFYLEFLNKNGSKGNALKQLCDTLDIPIEDSIAFGDAQNDQHMLEVAGHGVAMGNSIELLKNIADSVTLTNDEDGVAIVLEKLYAQL